MKGRTHIPQANGTTYCGRVIYGTQVQPDKPSNWMPMCIDTRRQCIEDATCCVCQRVDNRMQAESYQQARREALFDAACRWAQSVGAFELSYGKRRKVAYALVTNTSPPEDPLERYRVLVRTLEDLELDAQ